MIERKSFNYSKPPLKLQNIGDQRKKEDLGPRKIVISGQIQSFDMKGHGMTLHENEIFVQFINLISSLKM